MSPKHDAKQLRDWLWLALIVCLGLGLRAAAIYGYDHTPVSDELAYQSMAVHLLHGNGIVDEMGNRAMYNVGYPLFILAPTFFLFGETVLAARLANVALGGVTIVLCFLVAKEARAGRLGRLMAPAIWALYLPASVYSVYLLKENLMTPLMVGIVWCALRLRRADSVRSSVLCGVLLGLLALTGIAGLSLVAVVALALTWNPASVRRRASRGVLLLAVAVAIVAPWMIRNLHVLGVPVLNTNGGFNLYLGNNPAATGMFVSISDTPRGATWEELRKRGEVQASETLRNEAIAWAVSHPTQFSMLAVRKAAAFWTPPWHEGKGEGSSAERIVRLLWVVQFLALVSAALGTLLTPRLRSRDLALLWLALACYTAVHMVFYVIFRYRLPIMPIVGVLAALAIESLMSHRSWLRDDSLERTD